MSETPLRMKDFLTEDGKYTCDCGRKFNSPHGLSSHMNFCKIHCDKVGKQPRFNNVEPLRNSTRWYEKYSRDDPRYKEISKKYSEAARKRNEIYGNPLVKWNKQNTAGSEAHKRQSATMKAQYASGEKSLDVGIGRGKYSIFNYKGKRYTLRSTYEFIYALYMADKGIDFDYEVVRFNVNNHTYIADFLVDNTVIEVRGNTKRHDAEANRSVVESSGYDYYVVDDQEIGKIRSELNNKYDMDYLIKCIFDGHNSKNLYEYIFESNEARRIHDQ